MVADAQSIDRTAQFLYVQINRASGSPAKFGEWEELYDAKVEMIVNNINAMPSEATFWLPSERWNSQTDILHGDKIKILDENDTIIFEGFITKISRQFSGGNEQGGKYERLGYICKDYRWLAAVLTPVFGQIGRSEDDYNSYGTSGQSAITGSWTGFGGRRCVFNPHGVPNKSGDELTYQGITFPVFGTAENDTSEFWTAGDIARYIVSPLVNFAHSYWPIGDIASGIADYTDWDQILNNFSIEGLTLPAALQMVCKHIGWAYRIDYGTAPEIKFFKPGYTTTGITAEHSLFTPAPADEDVDDSKKNIATAVSAGKKILWSAQFDQDITNIINAPYYSGSVHRVEFTADLAPGWLDDDLVPDESDDCEHVSLYESELSQIDSPNDFDFYKHYHKSGSDFYPDVGRFWVINETGKYSDTDSYDRGVPFDWAEVLPAELAYFNDGKRTFGPFKRKLLPCLTQDKNSLNSIGIIVEFSLDGGTTWQQLPASIVTLDDDCGINIIEPNLAEIKPKGSATISGGDLDGFDLNYWTSLCRDKLADNSYKNNQWCTRLRITASIELDQRMGGQAQPTCSGSPFHQTEILDFSTEYLKKVRAESSIFSSGDLPANEMDDYAKFKTYIEKLRDSLQDASISGQFTLERLWLTDFKIGDCITKIDGRDFSMSTAQNKAVMFPEIVQIIYLVQKQKTKLITRDLRYSEKR